MKVYTAAQDALRLDKALDLAVLTVIPGEGGFSIELPAVDWEDGLQAVYAFTYDGKTEPGEISLPATMRVIPIPRIASHCMDGSAGDLPQDCLLVFEENKPIQIQTDLTALLTCDEVEYLNKHLAKWGRK